MAKNAIFNTVEEAIEDFREGRIVIVVDDEDREKRGRFHRRRRENHPRNRQFHALQRPRRALRTAFGESRCEELELNMMEENNTSLLGTPFTVTVDLLGQGCTTGVSIHDRAATIRALADPPPVRRIWGVRAMSIRCVPARRGSCAGRDIPKRPSIWPVWPDCSPAAL